MNWLWGQGSSQLDDSQIGHECDIDRRAMEDNEADINAPAIEHDESYTKKPEMDLPDSEVISN